MIIIEIAVGILFGYLLIKFLPLIWYWVIRLLFIGGTIFAYFIFFSAYKEDKMLAISFGLGGLVSMLATTYLFNYFEEDEYGEKTIKGFFKWLKTQ